MTEGMDAEILSAWRAGASWDSLVSAFGLQSGREARRIIHAQTTPAERMARRNQLVSLARQRYSDDELLDLLRACAVTLGRTPGIKAFDRWYGHRGGNGHTAQLLHMRFGTWADACLLVSRWFNSLVVRVDRGHADTYCCCNRVE